MDWSYVELVALGENSQDIQWVKAEKIQIPKSLSHIYLEHNQWFLFLKNVSDSPTGRILRFPRPWFAYLA